MIKQNNTPIFIKSAFEKGLKWVYQLFPEGYVIPQEQATAKYGLTALQLNGLISAIPQHERRRLKGITKNTCSTTKAILYDEMLYSKNLAKKAYEVMVAAVDQNGLQHRIESWKRFIDIEADDLYSAFRNIYSITNVPKYRSFQFRFLHQAIILNDKLYRWGIRADNLCSWCGLQKENMQHFFYDCPISKLFWRNVCEFVKELTGVVIKPIYKEIASNAVTDNIRHLSNFIVLIAKQFMYRQRCLGLNLCYRSFRIFAFDIRNCEKFIAIKNNKLKCHEKKWRRIVRDDENLVDTDGCM